MMDTYHPLEVSVAQYKGSHADDASALGSSSNMPHIWSRVCIKYVDSLYDVLKIASVLPLATKPPIMVLLHGLDAMIDASNKIIPALVSASSKGGQSHGRLVSVESLLCRTLATLTDAMVRYFVWSPVKVPLKNACMNLPVHVLCSRGLNAMPWNGCF